MTLDTLTDALKNWLASILHSDWLSTLITAAIIAIITAIIAHVVTVFLRRMLKSDKGPLPAVSIFVNIGRVTIWVIGICVILSSCFNVNVGAAVTALGIGGIAVSLGFQSTLSNLIGGLQIIMTKLIEPGDRIKVGDNSGMVTDVTWRHTTIITSRGEHVVIPNSLINTSALIKLAPEDDIRIDIIIGPTEDDITDLVKQMETEVDSAVSKVAVMKQPTEINVTGKNDKGYTALLSFATGKGTKRSVAVDAAMKAISSCAKREKHNKPKAKPTIAEKSEEIIDGSGPIGKLNMKLQEVVASEKEHHAHQKKAADLKHVHHREEQREHRVVSEQAEMTEAVESSIQAGAKKANAISAIKQEEAAEKAEEKPQSKATTSTEVTPEAEPEASASAESSIDVGKATPDAS